MPLVNFTNLDFDQIKTTLRDYLRANSNFTDYDFDGSNLSAILDVLAYNTYIASYNANMVSNEVFIDSATLRENVVSLARNIGYIPRSKKSAKATISFFVDTTNLGLNNNPLTLTLQKGISFTSENNFTFIVPEDITAAVVDGIASFDEIEIYEGTYLRTTYTVNTRETNQRFIINNSNLDTDLLNVYVKDNETSGEVTKFSYVDNLFDLNSQSRVFFIQEIEDQRYELIFGDGIFGKLLENGNVIQADYVITNGSSANGTDTFSFSGRIVDNNGNIITSGRSTITTNFSAEGGADVESVDSIRKYAPKVYAAQNRAVTASDYEAIIPRIYSDTESVSTFGGEELDPPKYGRVYIVIKPKNGNYLPNNVKDNIKSKLKKYSVAGIVPEIVDLKYLYIEATSTINYNSNKAPNSDFVVSKVLENVGLYASSAELNKYGAKFKYSRFLKIIDDSHESITSNITKLEMRRDFRTSLNSFAEYEVCFGNEFHIENCKGFNIRSSGFTVAGIADTVYFSDLPNSDGVTGTVFLFKLDSPTNYTILRKSIGTVDYVKGEIKINPIKITSTRKFKGDSIIEVSSIPKSNDIIGKQDLYIQLDINNSSFIGLADSISSGSDPAGSTFYNKNSTLLSSYNQGALVRQ